MYKHIISPLLDQYVDPEYGHHLTHQLLHKLENSPWGLKLLEYFNHRGERFVHKKLQITLGGIKLENPLIIAAGWDKTGQAVRALWKLGFAGVEIGSVPVYPQHGNPKPRLFRLENGVYLNRMGFNSPGFEIVDKNLERYIKDKIPVGVNVGLNKYETPEDAPSNFALVVKKLYRHAAYFVINVSSPNTAGLRKLQDKKHLVDIVKTVNKAMQEAGGKKPLYIKIAPDLTKGAVDAVIEVAINNAVNGLIATNTTNNPKIKSKYGLHWETQMGGVSGDDADYRRMSSEKIAHIYKESGKKLEIIGVGGVKDTQTALEKIMAGAKAIQLLSALRSEGPAAAGQIKRGLVEWMDKHKVKKLDDIVGVEADKYK